MDDSEIVQWIVHEVENNRYWSYLSPLSNYKNPVHNLPRLISASNYIKNDTEYEDHKSNEVVCSKIYYASGSNSTNKTNLIYFWCYLAGHTSKVCTKNPTVICFQCFKLKHKSNECHIVLHHKLWRQCLWWIRSLRIW